MVPSTLYAHQTITVLVRILLAALLLEAYLFLLGCEACLTLYLSAFGSRLVRFAMHCSTVRLQYATTKESNHLTRPAIACVRLELGRR